MNASSSRRERPPLDERERASLGPRVLKDPASIEYAWQTMHYLKTLFSSKKASLERWERGLQEAEENRIYDRIPPGKPYGSLDALLKAEIGCDATTATAEVIRLAAQAEPMPEKEVGLGKAGPGRGHKTPDDISRFDYGTNADYLTRRIARDRPDILEDMKAGKYKSVRAAALDAGIVKPTVTVALDPIRAAAAILRHFAPDEVRVIAQMLTEAAQ